MFLPFSSSRLELQNLVLRTHLQQYQIISGFSFSSFLLLLYAYYYIAQSILAILLLSHHSNAPCFQKDYAQGSATSAV